MFKATTYITVVVEGLVLIWLGNLPMVPDLRSTGS